MTTPSDSSLHALPLDLGERSYTIEIGSGLLDTLGETLKPILRGRQVAVVTNETVAPLYLDRVMESLKGAGFETFPVILPDGEEHKHWQTLHKIFDITIENRFERSGTLLALGGGVIGDMTGYAAASLLRGVDFVQVPTTLLSQVDASVGGKTGINHALGKNLIGAFYQPRHVAIDVDTLATLPRRELVAGIAEVIKYGIIWDGDFFETLEQQMPQLMALEPATVSRTIHTCCAIKADVVAQDERESGVRALLNLGHTFGHAIESLAGYGSYLHGEAVAIGTVMAARLSVQLGMIPPEKAQRIIALHKAAELPVTVPYFQETDGYLNAMARDKKVEEGIIRLILIEEIGKAVIRADVGRDEIVKMIRQCREQL